MIKKFLICGKQLYFQSKDLESFASIGTVVELSIPIQIYWSAEDLIKHANYLLASADAGAEISSVYRKVFAICAPYARLEKDRLWLYSKTKD